MYVMIIICSWSQIAARLPGRSDNEIKNFWNARLRKKLRQKEASTSSSTAGSKEAAARRSRNSAEDDDRTKPAPSVFTPFVPDHVAATAGASGASSCDDSSAAGSFVADPAAATCAATAVRLADAADRNAAAAESGVTPTPTPSLTTSTSVCTDDAWGSCDDGFLRAMVDDPSFLFGDFYIDGDGGHHGQIMSFWEGHASS